MSNQDFAKSLIDQIPNEAPNAETLEAFAEIENGGGHKSSGSAKQLFAELMED
ncbi:MAG TPA: hypothetical protein IAB44_00625 [Candidatus Limivivens intestinipullorum]|uniref:Uncharacterized protein n=1 Tax=Candidatus Limivivens intestinipullorum TaxID=2840858 RepID=A0A9D1JIX5_9FIRM|nr:hypothetical protein [Candidatus Limivivens intestinipullorum]